MAGPDAVHDSFTLERIYPTATPARTFAAWSTEAGRSAWFSTPNNELWDMTDRHFDFRIGGSEVLEGRWKSGVVSRFDATYHDIVPDRRIVYAYRMRIDGKPISVNLACVEFHPHDDGTRLVLTEHGIYLDGFEDGGGRAHGTGELLDRLGVALGVARPDGTPEWEACH
ncbi:SRPBCC family protein [Sphingomonas sp. AOB5]|uniref:SRPBCC family protein n=1 Tax=Sphingomonas sp. AOB5 TaxID=3034017 RepID=UPI0023F68242|nr:SRPBCC family protein [Sphingomonas sp. AOB5]MDF7775515.1 SRPBCC family protein [Sphingomonas sp. AOB5]